MIASRATRALKLPSYLFCIQLYEKPPCRLPKFHINKVGFSTLTHGPVFGVHYKSHLLPPKKDVFLHLVNSVIAQWKGLPCPFSVAASQGTNTSGIQENVVGVALY